MDARFAEAAEIIRNARHVTAFTGAGISVESGIPPFRGENGLWNKYDPVFLDIDYFHSNPDQSWALIKEIFYDFFGKARPNAAHEALAALEDKGHMQAVITQNIDNLHQEAGNTTVFEFHGSSRHLVCLECGEVVQADLPVIENIPPRCSKCETVLKPDFIFFGEQIPEPARSNSMDEAKNADVFIVIGTTGEIMPASMIPFMAKENGVKIIEVNTSKSRYTDAISDIFLQGKATEMMEGLISKL